jgi:hypothetical protein
LPSFALAGALVVAVVPHESTGAARAVLDPAGVWACVTYGHERTRDMRFLVHIAATGAGGSFSLQTMRSAAEWTAIFPWRPEKNELAFTESETGRSFTADLTRATFAGTWSTPVDSGGWWCARRGGTTAAAAPAVGAAVEYFVPPLIPDVSATPRYPRAAVREATQGYSVACFFVGADGTILEPEVVEVSHEHFRTPTLIATYASRYRPWPNGGGVRPGCRTYSFQLDKMF